MQDIQNKLQCFLEVHKAAALDIKCIFLKAEAVHSLKSTPESETSVFSILDFKK